MKTWVGMVMAAALLLGAGLGVLATLQRQAVAAAQAPIDLPHPTPNAGTLRVHEEGTLLVITVFDVARVRRGVLGVQLTDTPDFAPVVALVKTAGAQTWDIEVPPEMLHRKVVTVMQAVNDAGLSVGAILLSSG